MAEVILHSKKKGKEKEKNTRSRRMKRKTYKSRMDP